MIGYHVETNVSDRLYCTVSRLRIPIQFFVPCELKSLSDAQARVLFCSFKVDVDYCSVGVGSVLNVQVKHICETLEGSWNHIVVETGQ